MPGALAGGARALLAITIVAIVAAAIALPALRVLPPPWLWFARRRGFLALYAVAPDKYGDPQLISNASFSVWVFYPTKNGTVFQGIYNGTGGLAYVNLSSLLNWAEAWIDYYGPQAIYSFMPSLIVFVSYPIEVNSTTIEVVSQQEMVPLNLSEPLSKEGEVIELEVNHPFRFYYHVGAGPSGGCAGALGATARPAQATTTTTTSTSIPGEVFEGSYVYVPGILAWYPSNDSLGPISLAIAAAQPTREFGAAGTEVMVTIAFTGSVISEESINVVAVAGGALSAAAEDVAIGAVGQAMRALSPFIPGASLTFTQVSGVSSSITIPAFVAASRTMPDVAQAYIVGQVALVNWTIEQIYRSCVVSSCTVQYVPVGWQVETMLTAVQVVESGSAMAPAIHGWVAYDPCVNLTLWAEEYYLIEFGGQQPTGVPPQDVNASCPIPNTPAPVDWMDYAYNVTQAMPPVLPGNISSEGYISLEVNGGESPISVAIDAGSALVSVGAAATLAAGLSVPPVDAALIIAAVLGSVNFATYSAAQSANIITVYNAFTNATVYAYISNMTPLYTSGGLEFTLPRELLLINASAP